MIDFHSHILPEMDDGSKNASMSQEMLYSEKAQGVDTIILTPHFYADQNSPEKFLRRRARSWDKLCTVLEPDLPELILGAEVQYFEGISRIEEIKTLCFENTDILLLEMPFYKWDSRTIDSVFDLQDSGVHVVLAHIDRYLHLQPSNIWEEFRDFGITMQVNADFFDGFFKKRKAMSMISKNQVQFIGTDCHNMAARKPEWNIVPREAKEIAERNAKRFLEARKLL